PDFRDIMSKRSQIIGLKGNDENEVREFKIVLTRDVGLPETVFRPVQAEDEILIVTEYAAFPLRLISTLEEMSKAYQRENSFPNTFLHLDRLEQFSDMIPPEAHLIESLEDILYPCLALNLVQQDPNNHQYQFNYYDSLRDEYFTESLSPEWTQILETLASREGIRSALVDLLEAEKENLHEHPEQWDTQYLPQIRRFIKQVDEMTDKDPNYPYRAAVVGSPPNENNSFGKEGVLRRFIQQMERLVGLARAEKPTLSSGNSDGNGQESSARSKPETVEGELEA
ncbi:MAG: hypothetical protein AAGG02_08155, partial [Cyanobacteria bacterium P01_H01_bin.15]